MEDVKTGEKRILCSEDGIGVKFRRFRFDPKALKFIKESLKRKGDILVYDEIGYLETEGKIAIWEYIEEPAILIVREDLVDVVSSRFDVEIFEVSKENREHLKDIIQKQIDASEHISTSNNH